jgi:hypothetical protein
MQNAGIRIAHSLAVFEMRDCSPTVNDTYAPASGPSCCRAETGSTPDDCAYYGVADGDGQTTAACEAGVDVGGDRRSAAECRPSGGYLFITMLQFAGAAFAITRL